MVQDQGETINLLENNIGDTKDNTKETVSELKTALANEYTKLPGKLPLHMTLFV
jgi:hypothetical protein